MLSSHLFDKIQWLLKMSSIYKEIRTKHFDKFLMNSAESLSFYCKLGSILSIISMDLLNLSLIYIKWTDIVDYPIGFLMMTLTIQFGAKIGFPLVLRQMVIIIFFCRMHCFLFKSINKSITQISGKHPKNHLKTFLSFHSKLCESVEELKKFLRPMFVMIIMIWCPMFCYVFYFFLKNNEFGNHLIVILLVFTNFIFCIFIIILLAMIAMIDVEAKKGLYNVVRRALKISTKHHIFPVCLFS